MKIARAIVMEMIHHRLLPEHAFGSDNIEINDAVNVINAKLKPSRDALGRARKSSMRIGEFRARRDTAADIDAALAMLSEDE